MPKKIVALADFITASQAAEILSANLGRPISSKYIGKLARRRRQPVRTQAIGNRLLYAKDDVEACIIRKKEK